MFVRTTNDHVLRLTAVPAAGLPQLIAASGQDLARAPETQAQ